MNYITDGTFWVVVLILAGVIGAMWYNLKKGIDKNAKDIESLNEVPIIKPEVIKDQLAFIGEAIDTIVTNSDKKTKKEMENLIKKYEANDQAKNQS